MKRIARLLCLFFILIGLVPPASGQGKKIDYYLPGVSFDPDIPSPAEWQNSHVGEWHWTHDQIIGYSRLVAERSERVILEEYARSWENRPLILLTISQPSQLLARDSIRKAHVNTLVKDSSTPEEGPVILYQGFSIHGDEASGSHAAMLYLYYLAAGQGPEINRLLEQAIILLDPCLNPDGFQRFSTWANMHRGFPASTQSAHRQYRQAWPSGRTNHYWFDLNRDWLLAQHPESRGRLKIFHDWKPHVLTDHHEMGPSRTLFFQPGVPSRVHPLIPPGNQALAAEIATFHARALDTLGVRYYSRESFDDFYFGKGSTYPDALGSVGILFEQASSRGTAQATSNGILTFPFTIRNQLVTARTSLQAAVALGGELHNYQLAFHQQARTERDPDGVVGYRLQARGDLGNLQALQEVLDHHRIESYHPEDDPSAIIVPLAQSGRRLIQSLLVPRTSFTDSLFYDVSTWHFPSFFGVACAPLQDLPLVAGNDTTATPEPAIDPQAVAWSVAWSNRKAAPLLASLLAGRHQVLVATKPMDAADSDNLAPGTLVIYSPGSSGKKEQLLRILRQAQQEDHLQIRNWTTGLMPTGVDLGSPTLRPLRSPHIGMVVGRRVSTYGAGEVWHYLNQHLHLPVTILDEDNWQNSHLENLNTLIMPHGRYTLTTGQRKALRDWIRRGNTLILLQGAITWAKENNLIQVEVIPSPKTASDQRPYATRDADRRARAVKGIFLRCQVDLSHPLGYGYTDPEQTFFRLQKTMYRPLSNPYATPVRAADDALVSGYLPRELQDQLSGSATVLSWSSGQGRIIGITDQVLFRGITFGSHRLLNNAIFFGPIIDRQAMESGD